MKERQMFTEAPPTQQAGAESGEGSTEDVLKERNSSLQGRVEVLQVHNKRLENCIAQLKLIAEVVSL